MKFKIVLTWSKIMALAVLVCAFLIDKELGQNATFMFALPFIVFLITGKQFIDKSKEAKK